MKKIIAVTFSLLFLLSCATQPTSPFKITSESSTWDRYIYTDLYAIKSDESGFREFLEGNMMNINALATQRPYYFVMSYQGTYRPISDERKQLLEFWGKSISIDERFLDVFENEMLFRYGIEDYWFPVQSVLIPHFKKELAEGETVDLYTMFIGTIKESDKIAWVFLVNEFQYIGPE